MDWKNKFKYQQKTNKGVPRQLPRDPFVIKPHELWSRGLEP